MKPAQYHEYILSPQWKARAQRAIKRAGNRCQVCGNIRKLQVHHNTYRNLGKEKAADLCVLCARCHALFHDIIESVDRNPPRPNREAVRAKVACPTCGVRAGQRCFNSKKRRREPNHIARVNAYLNSS